MKQTNVLRRAFMPVLVMIVFVLTMSGVKQVNAASTINVTLPQSGGTSSTYSRDPSFALEPSAGWITTTATSLSNFTIKASSNSTGKGRIGYVYVKRQGSVVTTYRIVQPGSTNLSVSVAKGNTSTYSKNSDQSVSSSCSWISLYRPNNNTFRIDYSANTTGSTRTGYVYVKEGSTTFTTYKIMQTATVKVTYNKNGGSGSNYTRNIALNSKYGKVDNPTRVGYIFIGWWTATSGGSQVTETTIMNKTVDHTLYARWKKEGKNVMIINFDPFINVGGTYVRQHDLIKTLKTVKKSDGTLKYPRAKEIVNWRDPLDLASEFADTMKDVSYGNVKYNIVDIVTLDEFPASTAKEVDGPVYNRKTYLQAVVDAVNDYGSTWYKDERLKDYGFSFDYEKYFKEWDVYNKIKSGVIDEVWIFTGPKVGVAPNESIMVGSDAFYLNGPPIRKSGQKNFAVFGFGYERGVGLMLEDAGHRMEWAMSKIYSGVSKADSVNGDFDIKEENYIKSEKNGVKTYKTYSELNDWEKFWAHDLVTDGQITAGVGSVHCGPNARGQYDFYNNGVDYVDTTYPMVRQTPVKVKSYCDRWLKYPDLSGSPREIGSDEWGRKKYGRRHDINLELHHEWWLKHIPHASGKSNGKYNNWWKYYLFEDLNF